MLVDANLLLYAVDEESPHHDAARTWLEAVLNGDRRVGLAWPTLSAFLRISTNPRALDRPLTAVEAWSFVEDWLDAPTVWTPGAGDRHREIVGGLVTSLDLRANLIPDAVLAALCIEYGLEIYSADSDFARFTEVRWTNPLTRMT